MKRYSKSYLKKYPEKKHQDLLTTRKFCEKIKDRPYTIVNFVEGTRRSAEKMKYSKFKNLLPPKAGGIATTLFCLDYRFDCILDVTFQYDPSALQFWDLMAGRMTQVKVVVRTISVDQIPRGNYFEDPKYAQVFQNWLNEIWKNKDQLLAELAV